MSCLAGKVAIVTGGGSGIGAACSQALASAGASVVVADIREDAAIGVAEAIKDVGGQSVHVVVDVSIEAEVARMVAKTIAEFGMVDILHNNAAAIELALSDGAVHELDAAVWNRTLAVNATGAMLGTKHVIPHMLANGGGSIINTSSADGLVGDSGRGAYSASKGALQAFTRNVATQYGKRGIRCNAVAPGIILTELVNAAVPQSMKDTWLRHTLTPRLGVPEDIAGLVTFLASDAGAYITGQTIVVDGGETIHQPWWADELPF
ncbi:SDR family NAD(P)-dependent oxidoreductase [Mycobacterium sp. NPDC051804]|uniref:SDR family NAD(P)-dependent oxidoreductase n=1 Tax=Mycobacterium sp. NPDC051804 TaxID=3364295 RepID=UPI0037AE2B3A